MRVTASGGITIDGTARIDVRRSSAILSIVNEGVVGNSGGIVIDTTTLSLTNGGLISANTFGEGNAGTVQITASEGITLDGETRDGQPSAILSLVDDDAVGNSRGIVIDTSTLSLTKGGLISASTLGEGDAGAVQITASDSVSISGTVFDEDLNREIGGILAFTLTRGEAGDITIDTPQLTISEGAGIEAFTQGEDKAGDITIDTTKLTINGGSISSKTAGSGNTGEVRLNATESIILSSINSENPGLIENTEGEGRIKINASNLNISGQLGIFAETEAIAPAGNLIINPDNNNPNLNIQFGCGSFEVKRLNG